MCGIALLWDEGIAAAHVLPELVADRACKLGCRALLRRFATEIG